MRAHGTQKTKTKAMYSHKTKTEAHGQQNKSPAMCKTGHKHTANENTHKPRVHTRHENMKAHSQWNTQAVCLTAQDTTWMHAADKNTNCVHTTRHVDRRAHGRANSRPHAYTTRQNMERECPNPNTNRNSRHECRDPNTMLQHETRHADERAHGSSTLAAARSHENRTWPKWQNPDTEINYCENIIVQWRQFWQQWCHKYLNYILTM